MANAFYLLILLASLAVWQSGGDDSCDSVECLPSTESVCALDEQTGSVALFADECVLRCTGCRTGTEFKEVNGSLCSTGAKYITVCPDVSLNQDVDGETSGEDPGDGIVVVEVGLDPDGSSPYDVPPVLLQPPPPPLLPLPLPLLPVGGALLRRLVMASQPEPRPSPEGLTLISADVKVDVTINLPPAPPPPPQPLGQPHHHQHQHHEQLVSSAALPTAHRTSAAVAALVAVVVAALHV